MDFENRERIFPDVYFRVKFCLLTLGQNEPAARFAFLLTDPAQLADPARSFTLTSTEICDINPNTLTAPVFRSKADAELTKRIYKNAPVLIDEAKGRDGNPWGISFARLFDMSNDSGLFVTTRQMLEKAEKPNEPEDRRNAGLSADRNLFEIAAEQGFLPLYEAKMIHQFDHRRGDFALAKEKGDADYREIPSPSAEQRADTGFEITPRYWVPKAEVNARLTAKDWTRGWLMGWRDITNATNQRTVITTVFPRTAVGHTTPLFFTDHTPALASALLANWCSLVLDYIARQKVGGTHLTYGFLKQFPILPPDFYTREDLDYIVPRVLYLTYTSHSLAPFARDLGYDGEPFAWDEERRAHRPRRAGRLLRPRLRPRPATSCATSSIPPT